MASVSAKGNQSSPVRIAQVRQCATRSGPLPAIRPRGSTALHPRRLPSHPRVRPHRAVHPCRTADANVVAVSCRDGEPFVVPTRCVEVFMSKKLLQEDVSDALSKNVLEIVFAETELTPGEVATIL